MRGAGAGGEQGGVWSGVELGGQEQLQGRVGAGGAGWSRGWGGVGRAGAGGARQECMLSSCLSSKGIPHLKAQTFQDGTPQHFTLCVLL